MYSTKKLFEQFEFFFRTLEYNVVFCHSNAMDSTYLPLEFDTGYYNELILLSTVFRNIL